MSNNRPDAVDKTSTAEPQSEMVSVLRRKEQNREHNVSNTHASIMSRMTAEMEQTLKRQGTNIVS